MFKSLSRKIMNVSTTIDRFGNKFPLDFIEKEQTKLALTDKEVDSDLKNGKIIRRNLFKNVAYRKLIQVRYTNSLPKLSDFLKRFSEQQV